MLTKRKFHSPEPLKYIEIQRQMTKSKDIVCGLYRYFLSPLYGNTANAIHMVSIEAACQVKPDSKIQTKWDINKKIFK